MTDLTVILIALPLFTVSAVCFGSWLKFNEKKRVNEEETEKTARKFYDNPVGRP